MNDVVKKSLFAALGCVVLMSGCDKKETSSLSEIVISESSVPEAKPAAFPANSCGVHLEKAVEKAVSLSPTSTEIICELGFRDKLVGIGSYCDYPEDLSFPRVGSTENPDLEKIVELKPDAVFTTSALSERDTYTLNQAGISVLTADVPKNMEEYSAMYREISAAFYGRELTDGEKETEKSVQIGKDARTLLEKSADGIRLGAFVYVTGRLTSAGEDTFESAVLSLAGENMCRQSGYVPLADYSEKTPDFIIADDMLSYDDIVNDETLYGYISEGASVKFVSAAYFERPTARTSEIFAQLKREEGGSTEE